MFDEDFELPKLKNDEPTETSHNKDEINLNAPPSLDKNNITNSSDSETESSASFTLKNNDTTSIEIPSLNKENNEDTNLEIPQTDNELTNQVLDLPTKNDDTFKTPEIPNIENDTFLKETAFGSAIEAIEPTSLSIPEAELPQTPLIFDNSLNIESTYNQSFNTEDSLLNENQSPTQDFHPDFNTNQSVESDTPNPITVTENNIIPETPAIETQVAPIPIEPLSEEPIILDTNIEPSFNSPIQPIEPDLSKTEVIPTAEIVLEAEKLPNIEVPLEEISPVIEPLETIETLDIQPELNNQLQTNTEPKWEAPLLDNNQVNETVVYDTPDTSIQFQVDGTLNNSYSPEQPATFEPSFSPFEEYIEEPSTKKDPIIIISTLLIIASLIMAAAYYFMTQDINIPFLNNANTTTTTKATTTTSSNTDDKVWPIEGKYIESDTKVCPDKAAELTLNEDGTFTFLDLTYNEQTKQCAQTNITGTYKEVNGNLTLTTSDNKTINAIRNNRQSHAEIIITGAGNIELTLYRTVHNVS